MTSRSQKLRRQHRRVLATSLAVAAAIHVIIFRFSPEFEADPAYLPGGTASMEDHEGGPVHRVDVVFGPPVILLPDGIQRQEPPDRVLRSRNVRVSAQALSGPCRPIAQARLEATRATMRLVVGADGRVQDVQVATSAGEVCLDELISFVATQLRYEWLPDDETPAPVELLQPMVVAGEV